ncbi:hypothetical protein [Bdellovibrio sp. HCB209]|uniref:hypothetical protein n=1 Tax=Bdellovibrio sp. HCB209 TaxID=3394354 RepID=UPI0039B47FC1
MPTYDSPLATFKKLAESFTEMIEDEGVFIRPYANPNLIHFTRLTKEEQMDVISRAKLYVLACIKVKERHGSLTDNRMMVETFLHTAGLSAQAEDLALIDDNQFIEVYNKKGMHLFRSLNIFESTSYTFEDLCCRQWHHLYERPPGAHENMLDLARRFFSQEKPKIQAAEQGPIRIMEKDTLEHLIYQTETKWLIPVFKAESLEAALTVVINWNTEPIPQYLNP